MNDTNHIEVLRMVLDGRISGRVSEWPQIKPAIEYAITALSARASAGEGEEIAWESTTVGFTHYVTDARYQKFSPEIRRWYKPYRCTNCAAAPQPAQAGASGGGEDWRETERLRLLKLRQLLEGFEVEIEAEGLESPATYLDRVTLVGRFQPSAGGPEVAKQIAAILAAPVRDATPASPATGDAATWEEEIRRHDATPPAHGDGEGVKIDYITAFNFAKDNGLDYNRLCAAVREMVTTHPTPEAQEARDGALLAKWIIRHRDDFPSWITVDHACAQCVPDGDLLMPGFVCAYHVAERIDTALALPAQGEG